MTALLWARPMFALILLALVGLHVWTAWGSKHEPPNLTRHQPGTRE